MRYRETWRQYRRVISFASFKQCTWVTISGLPGKQAFETIRFRLVVALECDNRTSRFRGKGILRKTPEGNPLRAFVSCLWLGR